MEILQNLREHKSEWTGLETHHEGIKDRPVWRTFTSLLALMEMFQKLEKAQCGDPQVRF